MNLSRVFVVSALLLLPTCSWAVTTSPGKSSAHLSVVGALDSSGNLASGPTPGPTVVIAKAKPKHTLEMTGTISVDQAASLPGVFVGFLVNGQEVNPNYTQTQCNTASLQLCTITATFWLDLDAAELAYPGVFVGQPLSIEIGGGNTAIAGEGLDYTATFSARMIKK